MTGLTIKNEIHWHRMWSSEIGEKLPIKDSTRGLFIFDNTLSLGEIREALEDIPADAYNLIEVEEVAEDQCEFRADSGTCYRTVH